MNNRTSMHDMDTVKYIVKNLAQTKNNLNAQFEPLKCLYFGRMR